MTAPARLAAYRALRDVNRHGATTADALDRRRRPLADARDRSLVTEIVLGTLRWQARLDHIIAALAGRRIDRLDPEVLDVLRMSTFQLLHLDRTRGAAVVNDAVDLVRLAGKRSAAPFVNALLRRFLRDPGATSLPAEPAPSASRTVLLDFLSVTMSHPRWLVARWLDRHGPAAVLEWTRFNNTPPPLTLRANLLRAQPEEVAARLSEHGVMTEPTRFAPHGLIVTAGNPLTTPLAGQGLFFVQDEASQLVAALPRLGGGERLLDMCAAPGGKTTAFAAAIGPQGFVVAADVRPRRIALLKRSIAAAGARRVRIAQVDVARALPFGCVFDWVVLDAPCSGLGTIRRDPEIRWRRQPEDLRRLAAVQRRMLHNAAEGVAPGGHGVYATCSSEPEENEEVVQGFLDDHPEFEKVRLSKEDGSLPPGLRAVVNENGDLQTLPHRHGLEAFFGCILRRRRGQNVVKGKHLL